MIDFNSIIGYENEKKELEYICDTLKDPQKYINSVVRRKQ